MPPSGIGGGARWLTAMLSLALLVALAPAPLWTAELGEAKRGRAPRVCSAGGGVVVIDSDDVFALDANDGRVLWRRSPPGRWRADRFFGQPVLGHDRVAVAEPNERFTLLDARTGRELWSIDLHGMQTSPQIDADTVYAPTREGVAALELASGAERWRSGGDVHGIALAGDVVLVGEGYVIRGVDRSNGAVLWSAPGLGSRLADGAVDAGAGLVLVHEPAAQIVALDVRSGERRFELPFAGPHAVFAGAAIIAIHHDRHGVGQVLAFDRATLSVQWTRRIWGAYLAAPMRLGDHVLVATADGTKSAVWILDAASGAIRGRHSLAGHAAWDGCVDGERAFVGDVTRHVTALGAR